MDEPIYVRFRWTVEELLESTHFHWRHICRPFFRWAGNFMALMAIVSGCGFYCEGMLWWAVLLPLGGIYWLFLRRFEARWTVRSRFAKRPDRDMEVCWQISGEQLQVRTEASRSEFTWSMVAKTVRTPKGVLLYPNNGFFYWLPKHGFQNDAEFQRLLDLAKSRVPSFYVVT